VKRASEIGIGGVVLLFEAFGSHAMAACTSSAPTTGTVVTCSGSNISAVDAASGSTSVTINIDSTATGTFSNSTTPVPFSVDTSSAITNAGNLKLTGSSATGTSRGAVLLGVNNGNVITNSASGVISTTGAYNDGMAANGSNNILANLGTIMTSGPNAYGMSAAWGQANSGQSGNELNNSGSVSTTGSNARAASILGGNSTVDNSGLLSSSGSSATTVYMQGNNDTLVNSGTIMAGGSGAEAVFSNTVSSSFTVTINNEAGGQIISQNGPGIRTLNGASTIINAGLVQSGTGSAIAMGTGKNTLILQTGSQIVGTADGGGGGSNVVILQGSGTASNAFTDFQTLQMQGTLWNWAGTGTFNLAQVQTGTLNLTGTPGASAIAQVSGGATLQANAGNLPLDVTDDGLVRFLQNDTGTYTGLISGTGADEKTGTGTLTLAPTAASGNTYSGGTTITQGTLAISADNALGAATGGITFNGGTLQFGNSFDLAITRPISLTAAGGTIDTQDFQSTITQGIAGTGMLTKLGSGTLTLNGANTYSGGTTVSGGTLVVGDSPGLSASLGGGGATNVAAGATLGGYGTVSGDVTNAGTIAVGNATPTLQSGPLGTFTLLGNLNNGGNINIVSNTIGDALIVKGNYSDAPVATVQLSTVLNEGGPLANQFTDRLLISGNASGTTQILVNASGNGAPTPTGGTDNGSTGISIVQVAGASTPKAFVLGNGGIVGNDTFVYQLNPYGPGSPYGPSDPTQADSRGGGNTWDYRLQNAYAEYDGMPNTERPEVAPQVPAYLTAPLALFQAGLLDITTLHQRLGELRLDDDGEGAGSGSADRSHEVFARAYGGQFNYVSNIGFSNYGYNTSIDTAAVQFGGTILRKQNADGVWRYGLAAAFGHVWWSPSAVDGASSGNVNRYTFYGTATWQANAGWYADGIVFGGLFDGYVSTDAASRASNMGGTTAGLSLESGYPLKLTPSGLSLEPQIQVVWQHLSFDAKTDIDETVNDLGGQNSALLRLGFRIVQPLQLQGQYPVTPYFKFNFLQPLTGNGSATVGQYPFDVGKNGSSMQVGAGITGQFSSRLSIYGDALYQRRLVSYGSNGWLANVGVRFAF
jgi:outer membrane autotransporter protein